MKLWCPTKGVVIRSYDRMSHYSSFIQSMNVNETVDWCSWMTHLLWISENTQSIACWDSLLRSQVISWFQNDLALTACQKETKTETENINETYSMSSVKYSSQLSKKLPVHIFEWYKPPYRSRGSASKWLANSTRNIIITGRDKKSERIESNGRTLAKWGEEWDTKYRRKRVAEATNAMDYATNGTKMYLCLLSTLP